MSDKTERLQELLDERGIEYTTEERLFGFKSTRWERDGFGYEYYEFDDGVTCADISLYDATPEEAIKARPGHVIERNPRNYVGDEPKIPNMCIDADPDWVDWVASLRHDEPKNLGEAVEQIVYEAICFGGDAGPNGNECNGIDEGDVITSGWLNSMTSMVEKTITKTAKRIVVSNGEYGYSRCGLCDCTVGRFDAYCKHCGARLEDA